MDYIISREINTDRLYAYAKNRFWYWNESMHDWKESHLMSQTYEKSHAADARLSPEDFMSDCARFTPLESFEVDYLMKQALKNAEPCKTVPVEPVKEVPVSQDIAAPCGNIISVTAAPSFNFDADEQTNALLLQDAQTFISGTMARVMAAKHAHDLCANHYKGTWGKWCEAVGISRDTGDNMVKVAEQFGNIQIADKSIFDVQPMKLLYAGAKASTPTVIKEAIASGDITTYKEYQELLAQVKAEKERADAAEAREEEAWSLQAKSEARAKDATDAMQSAESARDAALADVKGLSEQNNRLKAENADLKKGKPLATVVDEEEVDRLAAEKAWGLADARNAELQADKEKLQADKEQLQKEKADLLEELAEVRASKSADPAEDRENAEACLINFGGIWGMARPAFLRLIGTGESFNTTAHAVQQFCDRVHAELVQMMIQNDKETQYE